MPYDGSEPDPRAERFVTIGMIVFLVLIVALVVGVVWMFALDASTAMETASDDVGAVEDSPAYATWDLTDAVDDLLEREGVDVEIGDVTLETNRPAEDLALELNRLIPVDRVAVPIARDYIQFLPAPCIVWISQATEARPVVFVGSDEASVTAFDPREGAEMTYPFSRFSQMYVEAGRQAVTIASRGYSVEEWGSEANAGTAEP